MAAIITEREVISEFLELYKEFTCLWDVSCKQYSNKDARNQALQVLLEKLKVIDNEASIATVKKKIENMRAAYKRELKKVNKSLPCARCVQTGRVSGARSMRAYRA